MQKRGRREVVRQIREDEEEGVVWVHPIHSAIFAAKAQRRIKMCERFQKPNRLAQFVSMTNFATDQRLRYAWKLSKSAVRWSTHSHSPSHPTL